MSVEKSNVRVTRTVTMQCRVTCSLCDTALTIENASGPRAARKIAEAEHDWIGLGPGGYDMACPAHEIPCPHCERPMPRALALSSRRTSRARQRLRETAWRAEHPTPTPGAP